MQKLKNTRMKTYNLSSNLTVVLKYFVPLVWTIFFGALCIIFWMTDDLMVGTMDLGLFRIGWTIFFIIGTILAYFTLMRLMRVEYDGEFLYVTNYFKIYKYPIQNVDSLTISNFSVFRIATIKLKKPGYFGKKIVLIPSRRNFDTIIESFSNLKEKIR